ncbi:hypothetical protein HIM_00025 [Hirsutella minnesotensis 3608]|nr:hypothetical protein HIM_00025 [Hirsutella minnesotensis 3608]
MHAFAPPTADSAASSRADTSYDNHLSPSLRTPPPGPRPHVNQHQSQASSSSSSHGHGTQLLQQHHPQQQQQQQPQHIQQQQQQHQQHQHQHQSRSVKRPRPVKSCTECRKRKLRCDRLLPCSQCQKSSRMCRYAADQDSANLSDGSDAETPETNRPLKRACLSTSGATGAANDATQSASKNGESPHMPLIEELAMRLERLEKQVRNRSPTTESSGGRGIAASQSTTWGLTIKRDAQGTRFFGQNSLRVMLNLFDDAKAFMAHQSNTPSNAELFADYKALHKAIQASFRSSMAPITVFVDSMMPVHKRMTDILPKKSVCDRLITMFFDASETIYRTVHSPTFAEEYELYWEGKLQSEAFLPKLLAVLSIGSRFQTKSKGLGHERTEGVHIPTASALVRSWLDSLKGKQLVELSTLQVEVLLLQTHRMFAPRAQDSWTQLGFIVRLAMTMGLHRDPSEFGPRMSVFLGEIRRRLWYSIVDMDFHMSIACNLPCLVRDGDFTCRPPRNLNDSELYPSMQELPPARPIDQVTDGQMQAYAALTLGVRMRVPPLINRVDTLHDYQEVIELGAKLERYLDDVNYVFPRHEVMNDAEKSKLWRSRAVLDMLVRRPLLVLYRPLAMGVPDVPAQISRAYLKSSMVVLRYLDELDPHVSYFKYISEMYHWVLKLEIMQAAMSVCFYIQSVVRPNSEGLVMGQTALHVSPHGADESTSWRGDDLVLWSPSRLINTVEKALDLLIDNINGGDVKDILCIALALETVRHPDPSSQDITRGLREVFNKCLKSANLTREKIHGHNETFVPGSYGHIRSSYGYTGPSGPGSTSSSLNNHGTGTPGARGDLGGWIMWEGWD